MRLYRDHIGLRVLGVQGSNPRERRTLLLRPWLVKLEEPKSSPPHVDKVFPLS